MFFALFGFWLSSQNKQFPFEIHAVILVEMIVVFNQWNMYGPTILFSS